MEKSMQRKSMMMAMTLCFCASFAWAGTVDPLLSGWDLAKTDGPRLNMDRLLAMDLASDRTDPIVGVILHLAGPLNPTLYPELKTGTTCAGLMTARLPLSTVAKLADDPNVKHVEAARLRQPSLDVAVAAAAVDHVWAGTPAYKGDGVIMGVIDTGIDWEHEDFDDATGHSRILFIFDQFVNGNAPTGFDYGAEFESGAIDAGAISEQDLVGHGTHVAGIAAGDGSAGNGQFSGAAPGADLIIVKSYDDAQGGFPSDMTIDGLNYLAGKAETLGRPMVVNMSLGGHLGPHDGTSAEERVIDELSGQGFVVCVAAGNEGEDYLHHSGPAFGTTLELTVNPYTPNVGSSNDYLYLNLWYDGSSEPAVTVRNGVSAVGPVVSGTSGSDHTSAGSIYISNGVGGVDPNNGDKQVIIQIDDQGGNAPASGQWEITVAGGSGTVHAWLSTSTMAAGFADSDQSYSLGIPATSEKAIAVAAWKSRQTWQGMDGSTYQYNPNTTWGQAEEGDHAPFSSHGPTRDGREKPDVCAPGQGLMAAFSSTTSPEPNQAFRSPDGHYVLNQGTSMASPFVAGVVALMLEKDGTLTASEIRSILRNTADTDAYTGSEWNNKFGAGKVNALSAVTGVSLPGPDPTGDVNNDETTSVLDLVMLVNHIVDPVAFPLDTEAANEADIYPAPRGDGLLNASDLARMVAIILGTDGGGKVRNSGLTAHFRLETPVLRHGHWWQPVRIEGPSVAAGQFVLKTAAPAWADDPIDTPDGLTVATHRAGGELRVVFYGLSGDVAGDGLRLEFPLSDDSPSPPAVRAAGVFLAAPGGDPLPVEEERSAPQFRLHAAPNPSPGEMRISWAAGDDEGAIDLSVFDIRGRHVRSLHVDAGGASGQVIFDGRGDDGQRLSAGLYFLVYRSDAQMTAQKIVLTR